MASQTFNAQQLVANTAGYTAAATARRAFTSGGRGDVVIDGLDDGRTRNRLRFEMRDAVTGAVTDAAWQMGGGNFTLGLLAGAAAAEGGGGAAASFVIGGQAAKFIDTQAMMARGLYWAAMGYVVDRFQGGRKNLLGAAIDGFAGPAMGDFIQRQLPAAQQ